MKYVKLHTILATYICERLREAGISGEKLSRWGTCLVGTEKKKNFASVM